MPVLDHAAFHTLLRTVLATGGLIATMAVGGAVALAQVAAPPGGPGRPGRPDDRGRDICMSANAPAFCRGDGCCHIHKIKTWVVINGQRKLRYVRRWHCHGSMDSRHCLKPQRR